MSLIWKPFNYHIHFFTLEMEVFWTINTKNCNFFILGPLEVFLKTVFDTSWILEGLGEMSILLIGEDGNDSL